MIRRIPVSAFTATISAVVIAALMMTALLATTTQHAWAEETNAILPTADASSNNAPADSTQSQSAMLQIQNVHLAKGDLRASSALQDQGALQTSAATRDYETPDGLAVVKGVESGKLSYDKATCTLTLNNVKAEVVTFKQSGTLTLNLKGKNETAIQDEAGIANASQKTDSNASETTGASSDANEKDAICGSLVVQGKGSLDGTIYLGGNLTVKGGTVSTLASTPVSSEARDLLGVACANLVMEGGALTATANGDGSSDIWYGGCGISCANITMKGGTLTGISGEDTSNGFGIHCKKIAMHDGTITATSLSESGIAGISCKSLVMYGGSITSTNDTALDDTYGLYCSGQLIMHGGSLVARTNGYEELGVDTYGIFCKDLVMQDGTLEAESAVFYPGEPCAPPNKGYGIFCTDFSMSGGTLNAACKAGTKPYTYKDGESWRFDEQEVEGCGICCSSFSLAGGSFCATCDNPPFQQSDGIACSGAFKMSGGKATVVACGFEGAYISCSSFAQSGGTLIASFKMPNSSEQVSARLEGMTCGISCSGNVALRGGKTTIVGLDSTDLEAGGHAVKCKKLFMRGGKLFVNGKWIQGIECRSLDMQKGTLNVSGTKSKTALVGVRVNSGDLTMAGGTLKVAGGDGFFDSVFVHGGNMKMTGGKAVVTDGYTNAVRVQGGSNKGGKAVVTGGKLTAKTTKPAKAYAVRAISLTYKPNCIAFVKGGMAKGFTFKYKGSTFRSLGNNKAKLIKRGKAKITQRTVSYAGHKYTVK